MNRCLAIARRDFQDDTPFELVPVVPSPFMASATHDKQVKGMIANLPEKTGKTLAQWIRVLAACPAATHPTDSERAAWLKSEHGLGHFQARLVVTQAKTPQ